MGIEAAMIVIADSAVPSITNCVVASVNPELLIEGSCVILMIEVTPALASTLALGCKQGEKQEAYNMPMLMATSTPNFSFLFMVSVQIIFHGTSAKTISMAPE